MLTSQIKFLIEPWMIWLTGGLILAKLILVYIYKRGKSKNKKRVSK